MPTFFTFEFTIVTSTSLGTELVPELRASTMSLYFAAAGLGRVVGAILGGLLWSDYGIIGICLVSGTCTFFSLIAMAWGFPGPFRSD